MLELIWSYRNLDVVTVICKWLHGIVVRTAIEVNNIIFSICSANIQRSDSNVRIHFSLTGTFPL